MMVLRDSNNVDYRTHQKNTERTEATSCCVKRNSFTRDYTHESDILLEAARNENKKLTTAAAMEVRISPVEVLS
jgi:hypothetical protein